MVSLHNRDGVWGQTCRNYLRNWFVCGYNLKFLATSKAQASFVHECLKTKAVNNISFFPEVSTLVQPEDKESTLLLLET